MNIPVNNFVEVFPYCSYVFNLFFYGLLLGFIFEKEKKILLLESVRKFPSSDLPDERNVTEIIIVLRSLLFHFF